MGNRLSAVLCFILLTAFLFGCSGSNDDLIDFNRFSVTPNKTSVTIGPDGGVLEVTDASSAAYGAMVSIPRGALSEDQDISISAGALPGTLALGYRSAGACLNFEPDGIVFASPVTMYLPYADSNNDGIVDGKAVAENLVRALYYNESTQSWEEMDLSDSQADSNRAVIESGHFSTYLSAIDTSDSEPYDTGSAPDTGDLDAVFESGDCFLEGSYIDSCPRYYLTVTRRESGLLALVDRNATYTTNGYPATISEDYGSATFDAASAFARVLVSSDAARWQWEAEFVKEHTHLLEYEVEEDPMLDTAIPVSSGERIYSTIEAVDASMVRISWQINADEQIIYPTSPQANGHMLVIRFRATYQ